MPEKKTQHRYFIKTWGCQMNTQDERRMATLLDAEGYQAVSSPSSADTILLNTCSVREKSAEKLFDFLGRMGRLKEQSKDLLIGVTGCVAQQEGKEIFARAPAVDLVLGPRRIGHLPALLAEARQGRPQVDTDLDDLRAIFWNGSATVRPDARTYITIMEGCNMGCTFCIVPRTRGREVHRPAADILEEARRQVQAGILEIELLGQTVNAYHHGTARFHHLLDQLASELPALPRIRFTSSHPAFLTPSLAAVMASHENICPHLHLPVQSGADRILKSMHRGYSVTDYLNRVNNLRRKRPGLAISTDIIVGYPTETEEEFQATLALLREVRFSRVFAFAYSARPDTPAMGLEDALPLEQKKRRLHELFALQDQIGLEENRVLLESTIPVLFDAPTRLDPHSACGRTPCNRVVNVRDLDPAKVMGTIRPVRIMRAGPHSLSGEPI